MNASKPLLFGVLLSCSAVPALAQNATPGTTPVTARENCQALQNAGVALSGTYWIQPAGSTPRTAYCDMETQGGGWTLVYNSLLGVNTTEFWNIPHGERFGRRGHPRIETLFYDGSLYPYGRMYLDVIEDLRGKSVVALLAEASGIDPYSMRFISPRYISGNPYIYGGQFAGGWAAPDFDGDLWPGGSCATNYGYVTQHYAACWGYSLGSDGDANIYDGGVGPHLDSTSASSIGLFSDGSQFTRVRRISRFVKW
ncbi:fibrinogen-like YCDxxxxGGGW domain-containing protein [Melittangium boletus]|uniref:Fibrinogen C-terminal domain-containing protein n=1 Tax=Melittangium boletus DSM 14713 TaxID=1294270 RepID=A0A250IPP6_9BACT|nr:fibrinogen-like YCDxxxxGGGW domain-containing protein [Melittangium boletus]ATB33210.1 hypothetical protein MEBOL_006699 [Melittangium boletus DSM 14713]